MNEESTKKDVDEPSAESLVEMPDATDTNRYVRKPGRGRHVGLRAGDLVRIDADLLDHFASAKAVNAALRAVVKSKQRTG